MCLALGLHGEGRGQEEELVGSSSHPESAIPGLPHKLQTFLVFVLDSMYSTRDLPHNRAGLQSNLG